MKMDIELIRPFIELKPNPSSNEYLTIDLGNIIVKN